jgi:hypothetical protein
MNKQLKEYISLVETDTSGKWIKVEELEYFANNILDHAIMACNVVKIADGTPQDCINLIKSIFGLSDEKN